LRSDTYEHSYHTDYGTAAAKYVDAAANLNWQTTDGRYKTARA
jgi:Fe-Mn family superoxide dismutase